MKGFRGIDKRPEKQQIRFILILAQVLRVQFAALRRVAMRTPLRIDGA